MGDQFHNAPPNFMKIHSDTPAEDVQIQIIPLIDVIFCILIFFILASLQLTRQQSAISVDLPKAGTGTAQVRDMIIVSLDTSGQTYVDQQPVTRDQLYQQLVGYHKLNPEGLMVLYAPKTAVYDEVVQVLDLVRSVGGDRVALATLPDPGNLPNQGTPGLTPTPNFNPTSPLPTSPLNPYTQPNSTTPYTLPNSGVPLSPTQPQLLTPGQGTGNPNPLNPSLVPNQTTPTSPNPPGNPSSF